MIPKTVLKSRLLWRYVVSILLVDVAIYNFDLFHSALLDICRTSNSHMWMFCTGWEAEQARGWEVGLQGRRGAQAQEAGWSGLSFAGGWSFQMIICKSSIRMSICTCWLVVVVCRLSLFVFVCCLSFIVCCLLVVVVCPWFLFVIICCLLLFVVCRCFMNTQKNCTLTNLQCPAWATSKHDTQKKQTNSLAWYRSYQIWLKRNDPVFLFTIPAFLTPHLSDLPATTWYVLFQFMFYPDNPQLGCWLQSSSVLGQIL